MKELKLALDELRGGGAGSEKFAEWLRYRFLYLVLDAAESYGGRYRREAAEFTAPFFVGLSNAIDRLAIQEDDARTPVQEVEAFIKAEIERARRDYYREISPHILTPASTNSMRRKNGQTPYKKITRVSEYQDRERDINTGEYDAPFIEQPDSLNTSYSDLRTMGNGTPYVKDEGGEYYTPSRMVQWSGTDMELFDELAPSQLEQDVLFLLVEGYSERGIARELNMKPGRVHAIREQIRDRAIGKGYAPSRRRTA